MSEQTPGRLPVVMIGGFLGAGKTTLLNHLLNGSTDQRFVVFVNDFGAINVDHALIDTVETDRISLRNGCVCCTLNDDLVAGIAEFARHSDPPDAILIEASGVSNPRALDASLAALESAGLAALDTRLYLIDAEGFTQLPYEECEQVIDHAAASDVVIINKTDLVSALSIQELKETLGLAAPYSHLVESTFGAIEPSLVLRGRLHWRDCARAQMGDKTAPHGASKYTTWSYETESPVRRGGFEAFAATLPGRCVRAKGLVQFENENRYHLFNLVGYRATLEPLDSGLIPGRSQLVVIGELDDAAKSAFNDAATQMIW